MTKTLVPITIEAPKLVQDLAALTPARVALGRSGVSLPTAAVLGLGLAHAQARDAVHAALDIADLRAQLEAENRQVLEVQSQATDRAAYLARPDWGRSLDSLSRTRIDACAHAQGCDLVLVISDGLSATAVQRHAMPLLRALWTRVERLSLAPVVIATQARVALADEIGERLRARVAVSLIGERPGLSTPDSLGLYLTAQPRVGRSDAERHCISNIHAAGLSYASAAASLQTLIDAALRTGRSGVALSSVASPLTIENLDE